MNSKKHPQKQHQVSIPELLSKASHEGAHPDLYANQIQISISNSEAFIDFYYVVQMAGKIDEYETKFKQRIVLPHNVLKGFASALVNIIAAYEKDAEVTLPNQRPTQPGDSIPLWSGSNPNNEDPSQTTTAS